MIMTEDQPGTVVTKPRRKTFRLFLRDEKGVTAIEFALVAFPFLFFIFAIIELGVSFAAQQMLSYAVEDYARQFYTGQKKPEDLNDESAKTIRDEICTKVSIIRIVGCEKLSINLNNYTSFSEVPVRVDTFINEDNTLALPSYVNLGGPSTINQLNVLYEWPVMSNILYYMNPEVKSARRTLPLFSTMTWQNEPYS